MHLPRTSWVILVLDYSNWLKGTDIKILRFESTIRRDDAEIGYSDGNNTTGLILCWVLSPNCASSGSYRTLAVARFPIVALLSPTGDFGGCCPTVADGRFREVTILTEMKKEIHKIAQIATIVSQNSISRQIVIIPCRPGASWRVHENEFKSREDVYVLWNNWNN